MAPITQETVDGLKDQIGKLENQVSDLEGKLAVKMGMSKPQSITEQMRIILMGPPGAGMLVSGGGWHVAKVVCRQGHSGARD